MLVITACNGNTAESKDSTEKTEMKKKEKKSKKRKKAKSKKEKSKKEKIDTPEDIKFSKGEIRYGVYTNKMLDIEFQATINGYEFEDFYKNSYELGTEEDIISYIENGGKYIAMYANEKSDESKRIAISIEKAMDVDKYIEKEIEKSKEEGIEAEKSTMKFCQNEAVCITYGTDGDEGYLYKVIVPAGKYMGIIYSYNQSKEDAQKALGIFTEISADKSDSNDTVFYNSDFVIGQVNDGIYTNDMFGMKLDLNKVGMEACTDETINKEFHDLGGDESDISFVLAYLEEPGKKFTDIYATGNQRGISVMLKREIVIKDVEEYVDRAVVGLPMSLSGVGVTGKAEKKYTEFLGEVMPYVALEINEDGVSMYQTLIFLKKGDYVAEIASYAPDEETAKEYIDKIEKIAEES